MAKTYAPPNVSALDVARYLLHLSESEEEPDHLSNLRLQKLLYYAQAWSLANRDQPLFRDEIEAWTHGPVVRKVYAQFADCQGGLISGPVGPFHLSEGDREFVRSVWEAYREFSATALRNMTHAEDPWRLAYRGPNQGQPPGIITQESMREYFTGQPAE